MTPCAVFTHHCGIIFHFCTSQSRRSQVTRPSARNIRLKYFRDPVSRDMEADRKRNPEIDDLSSSRSPLLSPGRDGSEREKLFSSSSVARPWRRRRKRRRRERNQAYCASSFSCLLAAAAGVTFIPFAYPVIGRDLPHVYRTDGI